MTHIYLYIHIYIPIYIYFLYAFPPTMPHHSEFRHFSRALVEAGSCVSPTKVLKYFGQVAVYVYLKADGNRRILKSSQRSKD